MEQLTKKETNRINSALKQSALSLFDTEDKISSKDMGVRIAESMDRCTTEIKKVLDIFLCGASVSDNFKKMFSTIDSPGICNISEICSKFHDDNKVLGRITIRTVFGGTEKMPFRGLSYILPAINLCEELKRSNTGIDIPNIEFLFMNGAGIQTNAIDPYKTDATTSQFINFARGYIEEFHPDIAEYVNFYVDRTFSNNIVKTQEYKDVNRALEEKLNKGNELRSDLEEMGKRRNASKNSIRYATLHTFVQDGIIEPKIAKMTNFFGGKDQQDCDIIISIGAKPEEKFYKARKLLADAVSDISYFKPKKTAQYIANINVPPYSALPEGELYLADVLNNPELVLQARKIDRRKGEFGKYHIPVQKAVEAIIMDINASNSDKDLYEFIEGYIRSVEDKNIKI